MIQASDNPIATQKVGAFNVQQEYRRQRVICAGREPAKCHKTGPGDAEDRGEPERSAAPQCQQGHEQDPLANLIELASAGNMGDAAVRCGTFAN